MASSVFYPATSTDTGYWFPNGSWFSPTGYNGKTAGIGKYQSNSECSWARFQHVAIPQGTTIVSAFLRLTSNNTITSSTVALTVCAELADSPTAPTSVSNANSRTKSGGVAWSPGNWAPQSYDSPDIATVIQQIVNRNGWVSGNALQIFVMDNGSSYNAERAFYCFGNGTGYPELHVVWQESSNVVSVTCGWSILASTQVGSSWRNMAVITAAIAWHVLARQAVVATWRVFARRDRAVGWRVLAEVKIGSGWRIYAGQQVAAAWRVMTGLAHSSAWRVLASAKAVSGWRIFRRLTRAIGWRMGEATSAAGREAIRLHSPICREVRAASPITRSVRLRSRVW